MGDIGTFMTKTMRTQTIKLQKQEGMIRKFKILLFFLKHYRAFKKFKKLSAEEQNDSLHPERFAWELILLGQAFMKLGQILSTRPDILPIQYIRVLEQLQDHVPPFDFDIVKETIKKEFGKNPQKLFRTFDEHPVASASLSQVHYAELRSGERVAVKIQRPNIRSLITKDLSHLNQLLSVLGLFQRKMHKNLNIKNFMQEFKRYTLQERDFFTEGKTYDRFKDNFKGHQNVEFPKIYWEYTTSIVLTMERISGLKLSEVEDKMSRQHKLKLSNNVIETLLQAKALTTDEHICYVLVPDFNFTLAAKPFIVQYYTDRINAHDLFNCFSRTFPEYYLLGEISIASSLNDKPDYHPIWQSSGQRIGEKLDDYHNGNFKETRHGEYAVEINENIETVFNFVTRLANYPLWHPVYTNDSHVIHVSGDYVFITPEVLGSVFRLDEIVDGYHLLNNGVITHFERNKMMKWRAPFSLLPIFELGTEITFRQLNNGRTRLTECFFFSDSPLKYAIFSRKWFSEEALIAHIREELTGVKHILENGSYDPEEDIEYLWQDIRSPVRFINNKPYAFRQ